jgi:diguanylate cyclase (GGDEF)-like protein
MFIVENAEVDARFSDNPLVTGEPHIRFYAGYPLRGPSGHRLGTLCIIDQRPRELSDADLGTLSDIGEMVAGELGSLQLASTDDLTGLTNRRGFELLAQQALAICRRGGEPASLLMIDMDGFKTINDRYGHEEGDRALIEFGRLLLAVFRESDVVARLGGDEFGVLLTGTSEKDADRALARLNEAVAGRNLNCDKPYPLAFSGGWTPCHADQRHQNLAELLRLADARMYDQKRLKLEQRMLS